MCAICGCSSSHEHDHHHGHGHHHEGGDAHSHSHEHEHEPARSRVEGAILAKNGRLAREIRRALREQRILAVNLVSSPGAGKTTLLERTISELRHQREVQVIEGDQETSCDADRIRRAGATAVQINTGTGCHLDAAMVDRALHGLKPKARALVFIENVGNLVCPALFDLGERAKVLVASVTEGEDKPLKYPHIFRASQLVLLNKIDLLAHVAFDVDRFVANTKQINRSLEVMPLSALSGVGLDRWCSWVRSLDG